MPSAPGAARDLPGDVSGGTPPAGAPGDYRSAGVLDNREIGLPGLLEWVRRTLEFRPEGAAGRHVLDVGFFANVVAIGGGKGLALTTDGVGTKVLVAEQMDRYDTIGIDCVAMNVNDLLCVGAEPVTMLDYVAVERARPEVLAALGKGLHEGARQAGVSIVGGEISQMRETLRGIGEGSGLDLVGMGVGLVDLDRILDGSALRPGDLVVGWASSGIHSNGLTLARAVLSEGGRLPCERTVPELGRTLGEELLEPTRIYVKPVLELLRGGVPVRALIHVTGDGLLNLARVRAPVGFDLTTLPEPPPIFRMIQRRGGVATAEMVRVFNVGIGFCVLIPDDARALAEVRETAARHGIRSWVLGRTVADDRRRVWLRTLGLVGEGDAFVDDPTAGRAAPPAAAESHGPAPAAAGAGGGDEPSGAR
jgi:phosphoribosylformylglycinamidine cyclo-ligase